MRFASVVCFTFSMFVTAAPRMSEGIGTAIITGGATIVSELLSHFGTRIFKTTAAPTTKPPATGTDQAALMQYYAMMAQQQQQQKAAPSAPAIPNISVIVNSPQRQGQDTGPAPYPRSYGQAAYAGYGYGYPSHMQSSYYGSYSDPLQQQQAPTAFAGSYYAEASAYPSHQQGYSSNAYAGYAGYAGYQSDAATVDYDHLTKGNMTMEEWSERLKQFNAQQSWKEKKIRHDRLVKKVRQKAAELLQEAAPGARVENSTVPTGEAANATVPTSTANGTADFLNDEPSSQVITYAFPMWEFEKPDDDGNMVSFTVLQIKDENITIPSDNPLLRDHLKKLV